MSLLLVGASPRTFTDFQTHRHDCWEIILNTEGEGVMTLGEREYPFFPGTVCVLPPRISHSKRADGGFRDIYLHTDSQLCFSSPAVFADDSARTLEGVMRVLLSRYLADPRPDDITEALFSVVLSFLKKEQRTEPGDSVVNSVIRTITASYNDPEFQVTAALTATGYSKDHLRRRFISEVGMTPNEYLQDVRLRYAKSLLRQIGTLKMPIGEIAGMCGFYDAAYFCRFFKAKTGMSPSEYARKCEK